MKIQQKKSNCSHGLTAIAIGMLSCLVVVGGLLVGAQTAYGGTSDGVCMVDRYNAKKGANVSALNCTSNDVQLAQFTLLEGPLECLPGEGIKVRLKGEFVSTAQDRYDVGAFVAQDGSNPNTRGGLCYSDYLHPASSSNTGLDLTGGHGPYYNAESCTAGGTACAGKNVSPGDICGDIAQGTHAFFITDLIDIVCQDSNKDNKADVGTCTVWANSASDGSSKKPSCTGEADVTAETSAKCTCGNVTIVGLTALKSAKITVKKVLVPATDSGLFDLQLDGITVDNVNCTNQNVPFSCCTGNGTGTCADGSDVGNGGTTGQLIVYAGTQVNQGANHTVGEIAGTNTSLSVYTTHINCFDQGGTIFDGDVTSQSIHVDPDDVITCTITNTNLCNSSTCDDGNVCTDDSCNPATGQCVHTNNTAPCNDGNACTTNDTCSGGTCVGGPAPNCNDGNVCTDDSCNPQTGCVHTNNTASCNDGNACTTGDTCKDGACVQGPATVITGPGTPCTADTDCMTSPCDTSGACVCAATSTGGGVCVVVKK